MILDYLWRYPPYIFLLIMVDLVSGSYPPVVLIPRSMVVFVVAFCCVEKYLSKVGISTLSYLSSSHNIT
jgi:hypothetical protein